MNSERIKDYAYGLLFIVLQIVIFRHLKFYNMQADIVLIYVLWIATRRDRTTAIIVAAVLGFLQDAMLDTWGLNLFAKTLLTFAAYNFIPRSSDIRLLTGQIFLSVLIAALFHNIIYLSLGWFIESYTTELFFWRHLIGNSILTALVGSFLYVFKTD